MPPQLRIDRLRRVSGRVVAEYSHHLNTLPAQAQGYGCACENLQDLREQVQALRDFLRQPEQMLLLAILARLQADPTLSTPGAFTGRVLTFDDTNLTDPIAIT